MATGTAVGISVNRTKAAGPSQIMECKTMLEIGEELNGQEASVASSVPAIAWETAKRELAPGETVVILF